MYSELVVIVQSGVEFTLLSILVMAFPPGLDEFEDKPSGQAAGQGADEFFHVFTSLVCCRFPAEVDNIVYIITKGVSGSKFFLGAKDRQPLRDRGRLVFFLSSFSFSEGHQSQARGQ